MPSQECKPILPDWLRKNERDLVQATTLKEAFLDRTFKSLITIIEETVFNERVSKKNGFLQLINPLTKIITFLSFIIVIALQRSIYGVALFLFLGVILIFLSKLEPFFIFKKILPITFFTFLMALPATLNLIVDGKDLLVLYRFHTPSRFLGINLPERLSITEEGVVSMLTLLLRVSCSALFVFLLTITTRPNRLIKSLMVIIPKLFRPIIGITYRYIFFLLRRIEEYIMGLESRKVRPLGSSGGRRWVASRIGLLFLISMELSRNLSLAMQSRGYSEDSQIFVLDDRMLKVADIGWLLFAALFDSAVIWKFLI